MKPKFKQTSHILAAFTLSSLAASLSAQIVWDGSTSTDFEDGTNWVGDTAPANDTTTDIAQLTGGTVDITADRSVASLDLATAGTTLSGTGTTLTLGGGLNGSQDLTLSGSVTLAAHGVSSSYGYTGDIFINSGTTLTSQRNSIRLVDDTVNTLITFDGGTLAQDDDHLDLSGRDIVLNAGGGTLRHINNRNIFGGYLVSGAGHLTMEGAGTDAGRVQLTETNTYTGGSTVINGGQAWLYNNNSLGADDTPVTLDTGGTLLFANNIDLQNRAVTVNAGGGTIKLNGNSSSIRGAISGSGDLEILGGGLLEYHSDGSALSGNVLIDNGAEIRLNNGAGGMMGTGVITLDNGAYLKNRNNNPTINNDVVIGAGGGGVEVGWSNRRIVFNGAISGGGLFTVRNDSSATQLINESNSYSGGTLIHGYVQANSGAFGTGDITLDDIDGARGGIQNLGGADTHTNNLIVSANGGRLKAGWSANLEFSGVASGAGTLKIQEDSGRVVLSNAANTFSGDISFDGANSRLTVASLESGDYTGSISGGGTLTYAGSGPQTIASSSTISYTGSTIVSTGTLLVNADMSSSPAFFVEALGITGGSGTVQNLNIAAGGKFVFSEIDTLTDIGTTTLDATFGVDDLVGIDAETPNGIYTLIANGADFSSIENFGAANAFALGTDALGTLKSAYFQNGSLQLVVVPEPSVSLLGALGALALLRRRRRA